MLSDLQATQGVIVLNGTTSRPWGALLSIVVTNAYVLYSVIEEISSSSQVSLDLWTQQLRMFSTYQRSLVLCSLCPEPFCFAGLCQPSSVFLTCSISRTRTHTICSFVPIFNYLPFSFFLALLPHPMLSFLISGKCFIRTSTRTSVSWLLITLENQMN